MCSSDLYPVVVITHQKMPWHIQPAEDFVGFSVSSGFAQMRDVAGDHAQLGVSKSRVDALDRLRQSISGFETENFARPSNEMRVGKVDKFHRVNASRAEQRGKGRKGNGLVVHCREQKSLHIIS